MAIMLVLFLLLAVLHLVYESIILPSLRLSLRFKMFRLRDRLRVLAREQGDKLSPGVYRSVQSSINGTIQLLYRLDLATACEILKIMQKDPGLQRRIQKRIEEIQSCPIEAIQDLRRDHQKLIAFTVFANSAILFLWLAVPVVIYVLIASAFQGMGVLWNRFRSAVVSIMCVPEKEIENKLGSYGDSLSIC